VRFGFYKWGQARRQAAEILARIGSRIDPDTRVSDLSFAHRQMVEIARTIEIARAGTRAMTGKAGGGVPVVILDEPTSVLERGESEILEREIQKLKEIGSVIFVSHRLEEVLRICDRIVVMRHGRIVADRPREGVTEDDLFELMIGQSARGTARKPSPPLADAKPVLKAEGLTRHGAFRGVSLSVYPGRVAAIVGTFGSGREEFCRALFGAEDFEAGQLSFDAAPCTAWSIRKAVAAGLAYLPAERGVEGVVGGMSAARNLTLVHPGESATGIFLKPGKRDEIARDWFERLDVRPREPHLELERFSGGNQQKVALAKWMASGKAKVLILDHPLRGLDPGAGETVKRHIRMACQKGAGLILLADTLEEALELGDEIVVMRDGEVTARFDMSKDNPTTLDLLEKMV
jgi:ribose transport system ATP-binding protein